MAVLGIALTLPSLRVGWLVDDHFHRITLQGSSRLAAFLPARTDIFRFAEGGRPQARTLMDLGIMPGAWWLMPETQAAFWRPATMVTHLIDGALWPDSAVAMHAHSILWYGLLILMVALLYRRMMGLGLAAGLAVPLFAIDDAHAMPVAFLANRNSLICAVFGVGAVIAHHRRRQGGGIRWALLALGSLLLSLLAKEAGVAVLGFLLAYELCLAAGSWRRRALALLPAAVVIVAWRIAWTGLGYGLRNVGFYVDPLEEPYRFLLAIVQRLPIYLLGQWAVPSADVCWLWAERSHNMMAYLTAMGLLVVAGLIWMIAPIVRADRMARFWAVAMFLAAVPACSTLPSDRLMMFIGIAAMGLLSRVLVAFAVDDAADDAVDESPFRGHRPSVRWRRAIVWSLIGIHLLLAPVSLAVRASGWGLRDISVRSEPPLLTDPSLPDRDVIFVNPPIALLAHYLPILQDLHDQPIPRRTRALAPGRHPMTVHRPDKHTLVIEPQHGYFDAVLDQLLRDERFPASVGEQITLAGMTVTIREVLPDGRPRSVAFRFDVSLEDRSLLWLQWKEGTWQRFIPPPVGQAITLDASFPWPWPFDWTSKPVASPRNSSAIQGEETSLPRRHGTRGEEKHSDSCDSSASSTLCKRRGESLVQIQRWLGESFDHSTGTLRAGAPTRRNASSPRRTSSSTTYKLGTINSVIPVANRIP